ncbi:hypothetical protein QR680_012861 [Steinernema hermaphroditum]|uniref:Vacuolar protein sorting-associated protein 16 homolog n=1 Tax=Steinernema hermaphroditum TaxID=289476 RepID=A0AA39M0L2_9BILA|nr:hypothetical protein QR680_012861 [Steinernema hermaphroditum]
MGVKEESYLMCRRDHSVGVHQWKVFSNLDGKLTSSGLAVLTESKQIFVTNVLNTKVIWQLKESLITKESEITAWTVFCKVASPPTVMMAVNGQIVMGRNGTAAQIQNFPWVIPESKGVYVEIQPNWDHSQLALFNSSGQIQIVDCNDYAVLHSISYMHSDSSLDYLWCGNAALCIHSPHQLTFFSKESASYSFPLDEKVFVDVELDGLKVFSKNTLTFFTIVDENLDSVFGVASDRPGGYLYEAVLKLKEKNHTVYDIIKSIRGNLKNAVDQCLYSAAHSYEPELQEQLLEAAKLGKCIERNYDSSHFVAICKEIKVLHTVRMKRVGIPLSFPQLAELKISTLLNRLIELRHWPAAMKLAEYMDIPEEQGIHHVLAHWASTLIDECKKNGYDAVSVDEKVYKKLNNFSTINYANIAEKAYKAGLTELAELLLNREKRKSRQVELLLKISESEKKDHVNQAHLKKAVSIASKSHEPDLIHLVLSHVKVHGKATDVDLLVRKWPQARSLLEESYRDESPKHLEALYRQNDDFVRQALFYIGKAMVANSPFDTEEKKAALKIAQECLNGNRGRDLGYIGLLSDVVNLLTLRNSWDVSDGDGSLREMFVWALVKDIEQANEDSRKVSFLDQLKKAFKISDKQMYIWKIDAYVKNRLFTQLDQLARAKKSPVGYLPFIKALTAHGYTTEAEKLMDKVSVYEEQVKAYLMMDKPLAAAKIAFEKKDGLSLWRIRSKYPNNPEMAGSTIRRFWRVADVKANGTIPLAVYRSQRSELRVAVADVAGPMVKGLISFATETNSDDGLPHTLEHLVFMGSSKYPWKGVLDIIANRCLASGTNAWTDQDHTAYTLTTLGSSGFLKVLPVYMDHVLAPTLTDAQYATEVHHINGEGEDAGVVYSEMQNYESDMESMVSWTRKKMMYPPSNSYSVETGGRLENLRTSCSNEKVREFHKKFYHLSNMMIVVCGPVNHEELLSVVESCEERFISKIPKDFRKPFASEIPSLQESQLKKIDCPADESVTGIVEIAWFGPKASELYEVSALSVLSDYLRDTAVSPLEKDFVQLEDPLCSHINLSMDEQTKCTLVMEFSGVPVDKLDLVKDRFFDKTLFEHADPAKFDMNRMLFLINQSILKCHTKMETDGHNQIFHTLIGHQLYGDHSLSEQDLHVRMNAVDTLKKLSTEPASFWSNLMQKYFGKPHVCVVGVPSEELVGVLEEKEQKRLDEQKKTLGKDGLLNCKNKLDCANKANTENKPTPDVLKELIVQDLEKFNVFDIKLTDNFGNCDAPALIGKFPVPTYLHDGPSKFIELHVLMDTSEIPFELRKFLMLWFEVMFESPAMVDGKVLPYEQVSVLATKDLISQSIGLGVSGYFDRFVTMRVKVEAKQLDNAAKWLDIYLKGVVFDGERLKVALNKLIKHADELRRDGSSVVNHLHSRSIHSDESNAAVYSMLSLQKFHEKLLKEKSANIVERLTQLRDMVLAAPVNVHLVCDKEEVQKHGVGSDDMWEFLKHSSGDVQNGNSDNYCSHKKLQCVVGEEIIWDRFEGEGWDGESTMETLLLAQYLSQCEGPLWRAVRGKGLAYGANIYVMPDKHLLTCSLYRCSQTTEAYDVTKRIVKEVLSSKSFEESEFEAAKRSLICELFESRDTVKTAAKESIVGTLRNTSTSFLNDFAKRIWDATAEQVFEKGGPHLEALFDDSKSVRSIVVHPSKLKEIEGHFKGIRAIPLKSLQI